jgi:hypothetical protein
VRCRGQRTVHSAVHAPVEAAAEQQAGLTLYDDTLRQGCRERSTELCGQACKGDEPQNGSCVFRRSGHCWCMLDMACKCSQPDLEVYVQHTRAGQRRVERCSVHWKSAVIFAATGQDPSECCNPTMQRDCTFLHIWPSVDNLIPICTLASAFGVARCTAVHVVCGPVEAIVRVI